MIDKCEYLVPGFLPEGKPLLIDAVMKHDGGTWGLYVNYAHGVSWLVTKAKFNLDNRIIDGWRVTNLPYVAEIKYYEDIVKYNRCGDCSDEDSEETRKWLMKKPYYNRIS